MNELLSTRRLLLIDVALIAIAILMLTTNMTVLLFHLIFVLLSIGAFYWKVRAFVLRASF
jgi:hypothetical protein